MGKGGNKNLVGVIFLCWCGGGGGGGGGGGEIFGGGGGGGGMSKFLTGGQGTPQYGNPCYVLFLGLHDPP